MRGCHDKRVGGGDGEVAVSVLTCTPRFWGMSKVHSP